MLVSHFEILFKAQAPSSPPSTSVDRVIQGYFLELTNLETIDLAYALEFVAVPPTPPEPFRALDGNTLLFVDTPSSDNSTGFLTPSGVASVYIPSSGLIRLKAGETAVVAVLPSAFGPTPIDPTPLVDAKFEVRGYVNLRLPALFQPGKGFVPQSPAAVKVLLTPQLRATYISAANVIEGQTQASLPTASGAAMNEVGADTFTLAPEQPLRGLLRTFATAVNMHPDVTLEDMLTSGRELAT